MSNTTDIENIRSQGAQATFIQGQLGTRIAEMPVSAFRHRMAGRRSAEAHAKTRRLLTAEEGSALPWRRDILQHSGRLQTPGDVRVMALEIVQRREPDAKAGKDWFRNSLYKRHPEIKLRWIQQLDRVRALHGSEKLRDYQAIFDNIQIICDIRITSRQCYFLQAHRPSGKAQC